MAAIISRQFTKRLCRSGVCAFIVISIAWLIAVDRSVDAQPDGERRYKPELVVQSGHPNEATSIAFSPDGKLLASGGSDGVINIWETGSGRQLKSLYGHTGEVRSLAFSPDGLHLISGSEDKTARLWKMTTGSELRSFEEENRIDTIAFSPDGKRVAAIVAYDPKVRLWDPVGGSQPKLLIGHTLAVRSISFSSDGKTLASSSYDKTTRVWSAVTGEELAKFSNDDSGSVRWSGYMSAGKQLAIVTTQQPDKNRCSLMTVHIVDAASGSELRSFSDECFSGYEVGTSADGSRLVYTLWRNGQGIIKAMDLQNGAKSDLAINYSSAFTKFALSLDGEYLARVGTFDRAIRLQELSTGKLSMSFESRSAWINARAFSPDGNFIAAADMHGNLFLWDLTTSQKSLLGNDSNSTLAIRFSPDGKFLLSYGGGNSATVWDPISRKKLYSIPLANQWNLSNTSFSPDGKSLAFSGTGKDLSLVDLATGSVVNRVVENPSTITFLAYTHDGKTLSIGGTDKSIRLIDVASRRTLLTFDAGLESRDVAFSPDGNVLATDSLTFSTSDRADSVVNLWDARSGSKIGSLPRAAFTGLSLQFSPDGKILALFGYDHTRREQAIVLFDANRLKEIPKPGKLPAWLDFQGICRDFGGSVVQTSLEGAKLILKEPDTGRQLATLVSIGKEDWAVVTLNGLFDASEDAQKLMHFVVAGTDVGFEVIALDQLKNRYHVPNLLKKVMKAENLPDVGDFAVTLYPAVRKIEQIKNDPPTFDISLLNRGGGIGRVELYVDGKQIAVDARTSKKVDPKAALTNLEVVIPKSVLNQGANRLRVVTWNIEGDVRSPGKEYGISLGEDGSVRGSEIVPLADTKPSYAGHFYAIVAGISDYAGEIDLRYAAKDAGDMAKALAIGAKRLFCSREVATAKPCERVHMRLLTSVENASLGVPQITDFQQVAPVKANFQAVFDDVAQKAKPEDVIVIYFAGHGTAIASAEAVSENVFPDMYLFPTAEATTLDKVALGNKDVRDRTAVTSLELANWVNKIRALKKAMIFDTCASGNLENSDLTRQTRSDDAEQVRALDRLRERTGFYVLMGSAPNAVSYEASKFRQGLLTYSLLEALTGAGLRDDKFVDVESWFGYSEDKVETLAKSIGFVQQPRYFKSSFNTKSFDVGEIDVAERAQIPIAQPVPVILQPDFQDKTQLFDSLNLVDSLIARLRQLSSVTVGDGKAVPINYLSVRRAVGGLKPSGLYTVTDDTVRVEMILRRDDSVVATITVTGTKKEIADKLVRAIIEHSRATNADP